MDESTLDEAALQQAPPWRAPLLLVLLLAVVTLTVLAGIWGGWALALVVPAVVFSMAMAINVVLRLTKKPVHEETK